MPGNKRHIAYKAKPGKLMKAVQDGSGGEMESGGAGSSADVVMVPAAGQALAIPDPGVPAGSCGLCMQALGGGNLVDGYHEQCHVTWNTGFSYITIEETGVKCRTSAPFLFSFTSATQVRLNLSVPPFFRSSVEKADSSFATASKQFGAWSRSEFGNEFGFFPEQVGMKCRKLWDELGVTYNGVLTAEVQGAPRIFKISFQNALVLHKWMLQTDDCIHAEQGAKTLEKLQSEHNVELEPSGCKAIKEYVYI